MTSSTEVLTHYLREHLRGEKFRTVMEMRYFVAGLLDDFERSSNSIVKSAKDKPEQFAREYGVTVESFRE